MYIVVFALVGMGKSHWFAATETDLTRQISAAGIRWMADGWGSANERTGAGACGLWVRSYPRGTSNFSYVCLHPVLACLKPNSPDSSKKFACVFFCWVSYVIDQASMADIIGIQSSYSMVNFIQTPKPTKNMKSGAFIINISKCTRFHILS